jgi:hypothetical protein
VDVNHVKVTVAESLTKPLNSARREREVRDGSVGRDADRAAKVDDVAV